MQECQRRSFTDEYKRQAAELVVSSGRSITAVGKELGLRDSVLRRWVEKLRQEPASAVRRPTTQAPPMPADQAAEIARLREENEKPDTEKDAIDPAHPGAAAYMDGTERTFPGRYSDYFWGGVLVLSALGSFGVGLRAFFHPSEQESVSTLRNRVLDLTAKIRDAAPHQDVVQIEKEIDHILRETWTV